jgi:predicted dehydrogenase
VNSPVGFALIGAGRIAQAYAAAFAQSAEAALVGIFDTRRDAAVSLAEAVGCPVFSTLEEMIDQAKFEAAVVCVPPAFHDPVTETLLDSGVHVLCEKPFTLDVSSACRLVESARRAGRIVTMASKFRFVKDVQRAKSLLASGALGRIIFFENVFASRVDMSDRWNSDAVISGGGVLVDNGCHSVDLMRYLVGPIVKVAATECPAVGYLAVEENARLWIWTADGTLGSVALSWSVPQEIEDYVRIYGSHGAMSLGWKRSLWRSESNPDWVPFGTGYDKIQALRAQVENFARAIRGQEDLRITSEDAIASVQAITAAYEAMRQDRPVCVEDARALWAGYGGMNR